MCLIVRINSFKNAFQKKVLMWNGEVSIQPVKMQLWILSSYCTSRYCLAAQCIWHFERTVKVDKWTSSLHSGHMGQQQSREWCISLIRLRCFSLYRGDLWRILPQESFAAQHRVSITQLNFRTLSSSFYFSCISGKLNSGKFIRNLRHNLC